MRAKSFGSSSTRCNDAINGTIWEPGQLIYQHESKQSTAKPVLEKLLNGDSRFEDYMGWTIENNIFRDKFNGQVWDLKRPFARLCLGPDTKHKYGINTEYFILCKKNGQTTNDVYLVERAKSSFDKFSVGRLLGSIVVNPISWIVGFGWERISGLDRRQSDMAVSYFQATKAGNSEQYTIERISELPADYNDYLC
ncbi:hypothetical protein BKA61DRAFT_623182, partial [Leptodontidium sp. MPI-SDFR-AT-0119]